MNNRPFFRQISKRLVNYHACLETLGGTGSDVSSGRSIASIKNHAGEDSFTRGQKYGRNFVVFESAELSAPSGNTANLVVTTGRYNKRKDQISGRIKKTWQLTLVGNANSLEGCYLKDGGDSVTSASEKICNSIEAATWNGSSCEMTSPFNKSCPAGEALDEIDSSGSFQCCEVKWVPDQRDWCAGETLIQKNGLSGTKDCYGKQNPKYLGSRPRHGLRRSKFQPRGAMLSGGKFLRSELSTRHGNRMRPPRVSLSAATSTTRRRRSVRGWWASCL